MKRKSIIAVSVLFSTYSMAQDCRIGVENCCTTPQCIEANFLSNSGINKLKNIIEKVLTIDNKKAQNVLNNNLKEISFLKKLERESKSPLLKQQYSMCHKNLTHQIKNQVYQEYNQLQKYDFMGGHKSAKSAAVSLVETRNYRSQPDSSPKKKKYKQDINRVSKFLGNTKLDEHNRVDSSDYNFNFIHKSCSFGPMFKTKGDSTESFKYDFSVPLKDLKSKKYQKTLEKIASKKKLQINFNVKCSNAKNKVEYKSSKNELYIETKGKGFFSCSVVNREVHSIPGYNNGGFYINPIELAYENKLFK